MGNCCGSESSTVWATLDEWEREDEDSVPRTHPVMEKEYGAGDDSKSTESAASTPSKEHLNLKITKKELAQLLGNARLQEVPMDRVLSRLMAAVDLSHVQRQRSWAPTLHTIAE
ncbi:hypothetical protein ACS0TY_032770 [Phlomoides rotata]